MPSRGFKRTAAESPSESPTLDDGNYLPHWKRRVPERQSSEEELPCAPAKRGSRAKFVPKRKASEDELPCAPRRKPPNILSRPAAPIETTTPDHAHVESISTETPHAELANTEPSQIMANKKPRLDIQDQIKRASALAAQLRDGVKDGADTKAAAANQIATEELLRIFESMQEKTVDASQSFECLVQAQIRTEVESMMEFLKRNSFNSYPLGVEIKDYLVSNPGVTSKSLTETVQKKMENVTSGDYIVKIQELIKEAVREKFLKGVGEKFDKILAPHGKRP